RIENRERWVNALINTEIPIRLVNGPMDPVSGAHMVERYKELVPNPDCVLLDNIGHYPNVEAPYYVNLEVLKFFQE
ncbi:MAG: alpha/beta hydrolase, partial [Saprospiraceae bacterium]|nr:alpha/beta hydrolase [Saprospiraceae bacterium]